MGWITFATASIAEPVCKAIIVYRLKKYMSIVRILVYSIDVGTDAYAAYIFFYCFGHPAVLGRITVISILLPIIITAIALIFDIVTDPEKSILRKILLVPVVICCSIGIPLFYLVRDAIDSFQAEPTGNSEVASARSRLSEAFLEALPQIIVQTSSILLVVLDVGNVEVWQILSLTSSLISLSFTIASSTYLFKANFSTRAVFFCCSLIALTSRLLIDAELFFIPLATLLTASITVWIIKRVCGRCCSCCVCSCRCVPLAEVHHTFNPWSLIHVLITWVVTAVCNCYTLTGLLMSTITLVWATCLAVLIIAGPSHSYTIFISTCLAFALMTFIMNVVFLIVPKFRRNLGDRWLNVNQVTGAAQFY